MQIFVSAFFKSITRGIPYGLLVCLSFLLCTSCASQKTIVNGLEEKEANEILVFLASKGIDASKLQSKEATGGGGSKVVLWDISVSPEQYTEAMALLNQAGLPRRRSQNLLGIFSNSTLVPSELQEKIRYRAGLAEQIGSTIRKIDGILDAEVNISFPEEDPLNPTAEKKQKITASVYVKHSGILDDPNSHLVTKIKRLVAASVPGLDFDNVTVISDRARFGEYPGEKSENIGSEEKHYVSIWSVVVAQESVTLFRVIFFSFSLLVLLLALSLIWLSWKVYPLLKEHGGVKALLHVHPLLTTPSEKPPEEETKESSKENKPGDKDSEGGVT